MQSGIAAGTSRDEDKENQERNEDRSQNNPDPEVSSTINRSPHSVNSDAEAVFHKNCSYFIRENFRHFRVFN